MRNNRLKINIVVNTDNIGKALISCLKNFLNIEEQKIILFDQLNILDTKILDTDFWIIEAFNYKNGELYPDGFRLAYSLAGQMKSFVLFLYTPENFPVSGKFWCNIYKEDFIKKIKNAINEPPPKKEDFEKLMNLWEKLKYTYKSHHHE